MPAGAAQLSAERIVSVPPDQARGPLSVQQVSAVEMLVAGASDAKTAKAVRVHRVTVTRWRLYNFHFQAELNRRRQEVWGSAADGVRGLLATAVRVIRRQLKSDDPATAFRAARALLALAGAGKFAPQDAPADPMALLDAAARPRHVERRAAERGDDPAREPVTDADRLAALNDLARRMKALLQPKEGEGKGGGGWGDRTDYFTPAASRIMFRTIAVARSGV